MPLHINMGNTQLDEEVHEEEEILKTVVDNIRKAIMANLFQCNFKPQDAGSPEECDMEIIRLYRGIFTTAVNKELFDMIDARIQEKLSTFNK